MRMKLPMVAVAAGLAACSPATAQSSDRPVDEPPRPNVYEVAPEHAQRLAELRQDPEPPRFLEVTGTGRVSVPADRARVAFAVETEARTAGEASARNAERMTAVLGAVRALGLSGLSVETSGYALHPEYERPSADQGGPAISGYRATNTMTATLPDVDEVGRVIDAAIGAGANRVAALTFEASDTESARAEALRIAVRRAAMEAAAMAEALGVPLGPPLEVRGGANVPGPGPVMAARVEMAADTPVEPGQQTVTASVTVKYRIGG